MSTEMQQIETIRSLTLSQLEQIREDPNSSYSLNGQQVSWTKYVESLESTVDWCDRKLVDYGRYEIKSQGISE